MIQNVIQGELIGSGLKIGIVVARFNDFITERLLNGAIDTLSRHAVSKEDIFVFWVPGAFEIPFTATKLVDTGRFDAVICLGAVIKGATPHFDIVCGESAKGITNLNQEGLIPVINGIITTNSIEQAIERAGTKAGNKGADAAMAAIEMATLSRAIDTFESAVDSAELVESC